jgi:methyl-accepting chemotaxis protein
VSDALGVNAASAREAAAVAAEANETSSAGVDASRMTIEKMQTLFQKAEEASRLVVEFEQKIQFVHRITEMITTVADKTHLLSLNASIEAARAGDAGRGFSAVAEEIRKLTENAGTQAEQIEELIRELEEQSRSISGVMQGMGPEVKDGRVELDRISNALEQIQAKVAQVSERSETIASTAEKQAVAAGQIVEDIDGVSSVASQNAAASDEMRGALEIQTGSMEQMVSHAAALSEMSAQLGEVARRFRTR